MTGSMVASPLRAVGAGHDAPHVLVVAQTVVLFSSAITALLAATLLIAGMGVMSEPTQSGTEPV